MAWIDWPGQANTRCVPLWFPDMAGDWVFPSRDAGVVFFVLDRAMRPGTAVLVSARQHDSDVWDPLTVFFAPRDSRLRKQTFWFAVATDSAWQKFTLRLDISRPGAAAQQFECKFHLAQNDRGNDTETADCYVQDVVHPDIPGYAYPDLCTAKPPSNRLVASAQVARSGSQEYLPAVWRSRLESAPEVEPELVPGIDSFLRLTVRRKEDPGAIQRRAFGETFHLSAFMPDRMYRLSRIALERETLPLNWPNAPNLQNRAIKPLLQVQSGANTEYHIPAPQIGDFIIHRPSIGEEKMLSRVSMPGKKREQLESRFDPGWGVTRVHVFEVGLHHQLIPVGSNLKGADGNFPPASMVLATPSQPDGLLIDRETLAERVKIAINSFFTEETGVNLVQSERNSGSGIADLYSSFELHNTTGKVISETSLLSLMLVFSQHLHHALVSSADGTGLEEAFDVLGTELTEMLDTGEPSVFTRFCAPMLSFMFQVSADIRNRLPAFHNQANGARQLSNRPTNSAFGFAETLETLLTEIAECDPDASETWCFKARPDEMAQLVCMLAGGRYEMVKWLIEKDYSLPFGSQLTRTHIPSGQAPFQDAEIVHTDKLFHSIIADALQDNDKLKEAIERIKPVESNGPGALLCMDAALRLQGHSDFLAAVGATRHLEGRFGKENLQSAFEYFAADTAHSLQGAREWLKTNQGQSFANGIENWPNTAVALAHILSTGKHLPDRSSTASGLEVPADEPENADQQAAVDPSVTPVERSEPDSNEDAAQANLRERMRAQRFRENLDRKTREAMENAVNMSDVGDEIKEMLRTVSEAKPDDNGPTGADKIRKFQDELADKVEARSADVQDLYNAVHPYASPGNSNAAMTNEQAEDMDRQYEDFQSNHVGYLKTVRNQLGGQVFNDIDKVQAAINAADEFIETWRHLKS
ncbi:hypothetical protein [Hoeflea sp.]|uniref:hypothetical protein n=1 Tax=Hoeflea sp. TaxID=1940281 RepID=UPI003749F0DE